MQYACRIQIDRVVVTYLQRNRVSQNIEAEALSAWKRLKRLRLENVESESAEGCCRCPRKATSQGVCVHQQTTIVSRTELDVARQEDLGAAAAGCVVGVEYSRR